MLEYYKVKMQILNIKRNITKILKIMILDLFMDINGENKNQLMYIINELKK